MPALLLADTSAASVMHSFVSPIMLTLCATASLACVFFIVNGGIVYMTSAGKPENLDNAKRIIRNALIGLVLVFAAGALTQILTNSYAGTPAVNHASVPNLTAISPAPGNGLVSVIIKAISGVLLEIVRVLTTPFIKTLTFFTKSTPLMADNQTVFNLWLGTVGMSDALFVLVIALLGFHVMSVTTFGLDEIEIKHILPRLALIFLGVNISIFAIDGIIELSNVMIHAVTLANGTSSLWDSLTDVVKQSASMSFPALLIMVLFTIFSVVLVIYYVMRLIVLYLGAILSPLVLLLWLVPGFRDFSLTAARAYLMTIFVLFVQVVVLIVAGSLIAGVVVGSPTQVSGELMPMVTGVAAMYAVLKVPSVMERLSLASMGQQSVRQLGGQFIYGMRQTYSTGKTTFKGGKALHNRIHHNDKDSNSGSTDNTGQSKPVSGSHAHPGGSVTYKPPKSSTDQHATGRTSQSKHPNVTIIAASNISSKVKKSKRKEKQ